MTFSKSFILCITVFVISSFSTPCYSAEKWAVCNVKNVMVWNQKRLHIICSPSIEGFSHFAVPWSNTEFLNQILDITTAAITFDKTVKVRYNDSDIHTGPTFGCAEKTCHPLIAITLNK